MADDGNHQRKPDFRTAVEDLKALATVLYAPSAELAPRFARFLREVFGGDEDLIGFVRRFAGYSLTGSAEERVFAILHGRGIERQDDPDRATRKRDGPLRHGYG